MKMEAEVHVLSGALLFVRVPGRTECHAASLAGVQAAGSLMSKFHIEQVSAKFLRDGDWFDSTSLILLAHYSRYRQRKGSAKVRKNFARVLWNADFQLTNQRLIAELRAA